ncbi:polyphosphate:nucleotide phosphotransferase, PPK2 family [Gemmatirosa kalamazoonensis]|uniref:Polyphosphate:nucleotide phosphotransferase, PPK2 family n=1 Tax=Gemmatirosa kalamazoonensis TaxID=861299 RepID=W0RBQ0_9BACT|nr:PPK2 family polyphosphate kinase [Gemmatirosa kalamazoonensis]AHG88534.1 polyphosphate:nucleotide phosphotransferase, PPK2 family [Gemmatirosa kalamazoonensis]
MTKHLAPVPLGERPDLDDRDAAPPRWAPDRDDLRDATHELLDRLGELQASLYADGRRALMVVLQGRDASGKDGVIRRVFSALNPQGSQVARFEAPTPLDRRHDFLWRVHAVVPPHGIVGIFNRSHYEDVLVARVRGLVPESTWRRRYAHINAFEQLLADEGVVQVKLCLHISREEQRQRLLERVDDPSKNWKFREGDLDDRALWSEYTAAYRDALAQTSTTWAPWYVVPADDKRARDWLIADLLVRTLERLDYRPPVARPELVAKWRQALTGEA